jgi:hypothetical protein
MRTGSISYRIASVIISVLTAMAFLPATGQETNHSCGSVNVHNPNVSYREVTDIDGNDYKTVTIGTLVWFTENLRSTGFQNGDANELVCIAVWARHGLLP